MFEIFKRHRDRIKVEGSNIYIDNKNKNVGRAFELLNIFELTTELPEIKIYENQDLVRTFRLDAMDRNPDLTGQFLHSSIRVFANSGVMIDGVISKNNVSVAEWTDANYEAIRLQPFFLSDKSEINTSLQGRGLFERGLHFSGVITPDGVRCICVCDVCNLSFTVQHFHAGFSELQYFYSTDSQETLVVPYGAIEGMPAQLQSTISDDDLRTVEAVLPKPSNGPGTFNYYNSFRCPHCHLPYIDFENFREMRPNEYYGNTYINQEVVRLSD
ncbi:hypothetical protein DYU05_11745 [Mucilaginibacter terrenus]|uniref:Uncharacterized protein n=1 Tax=Mucilaginibacter terrenus TaxID=2482727 RepID=A0A3E2NPL3_9SPHI|nr:hypothetical protein [Mucilaginibacter terrenus]RFZ82830.1 hypothetical protein DYU05_11745 [Mucilaginibacter terrenus]